MRILFIADAMFQEKPGGSRRVSMELAKRLSLKGHKITFLVPKISPGLKEREIFQGMRIARYSFSNNLFLSVVSKILNCHLAFRRLLKEEEFDLVCIHFAYSALGILLFPKTKHLPIVRIFYGPWADEHREEVKNRFATSSSYMKKFLLQMKQWLTYKVMYGIEEFCFDRSIEIDVLSEFSKHLLINNYNVPNGKIKVISGGVDTQRFTLANDKKAIKKRLALPKDKIILLTIRRLTPRMGLENLIEAMSYVVGKRKDVLLVIGGTGFLREGLECLVDRCALRENIQFRGFIPEEELPLYYQAASVFILPTIALEGFGLIILEALACGTPVLGTPVGAIPELIRPLDRNLLFKDTKPISIAQGILDFLSSPYEEKYPPRWLRGCVKQNYSWEKVTSQIEDLFAAVMNWKKSKLCIWRFDVANGRMLHFMPERSFNKKQDQAPLWD